MCTGYRRQWGTFQSTYLLAKLSTLLIIAVIDPDNCLFRTLSRNGLAIGRQIVLLVAMFAFFLVQCFLAPFLEPVNNASEFTSRINYVLTAALSLGVALNIPGKDLLTGPLLYLYVKLFMIAPFMSQSSSYRVYIVTYGLSACMLVSFELLLFFMDILSDFTIIDLSAMHIVVKSEYLQRLWKPY
jgi:hypothetical protein